MFVWKRYQKERKDALYRYVDIYRGLFLFGFILLYGEMIHTDRYNR